ncbi:MAG: SAM-dependent methyltransferase [Sphingomonadales bacterium]|nr:SAM-dependent methyltransferase [Sphingomonadales bacterium]
MSNGPKPGTLYLLPAPLHPEADPQSLPVMLAPLALQLTYWVVESERSARRFLRALNPGCPIDTLQFSLLNEHTRPEEVLPMLGPARAGHNIGLMSDAGCPAVADPGAQLVAEAHKHFVPVHPVAGPSSLLLTLMGSGMDGQKFSMHGYLPVDASARTKALKGLEDESRRQGGATQLFIETPYRNRQMMAALEDSLRGSTRLCIGASLGSPQPLLLTRTLSEWKGNWPDLHKIPAVFAVQAK